MNGSQYNLISLDSTHCRLLFLLFCCYFTPKNPNDVQVHQSRVSLAEGGRRMGNNWNNDATVYLGTGDTRRVGLWRMVPLVSSTQFISAARRETITTGNTFLVEKHKTRTIRRASATNNQQKQHPCG